MAKTKSVWTSRLRSSFVGYEKSHIVLCLKSREYPITENELMSVTQRESRGRDESGMSQWEVIKGPERPLEEPEQPEHRGKTHTHAPNRILIRNALYIQITYQVLRGQGGESENERENLSLPFISALLIHSLCLFCVNCDNIFMYNMDTYMLFTPFIYLYVCKCLLLWQYFTLSCQ